MRLIESRGPQSADGRGGMILRRAALAVGFALAVLATASAVYAQLTKAPRIGVLLLTATPEQFDTSFREGLRAVGYVAGQNIIVDYRYAAGNVARLPALASELVQLKVAVLVAETTSSVQAAQRETRDIPIVMAPAGDPLGTALVASLAHPGGNVTGLSTIAADVGGKLLQLIREVSPAVIRVAVVAQADNAFGRQFVASLRSAAPSAGMQMNPVMVRGVEDWESAFTAIAAGRAGAVVIQPILATREAATLALRHRLPSITTSVSVTTFPEFGGLMSYGPDPADHPRRAAAYVDKILKGAKPADLPVEQPTKFELIINLKTANALGLTIPHSLLLRADRVIQ